MDQGYDTLQIASKHEGASSPVRQVQIIRSELELSRYLAPSDTQFMEARGVEGLELAQRQDYPRLADQIDQLLQEFLN